MRLTRFAKARTAVHDDGVLDAGFALGQIGLEHFELHADAAGLAAQQKLGVRKGEPVRVGLQRQAFVGVGLQFGPGVGEAALFQVV